MNVEEAIKQRQSVRHFTDQEINVKVIKDIVKVAQKAPSWVNAQPQKIYVAVGKTLERIRQQQEKHDQQDIHLNSDVSPMSRNLWSKQAQKNMAAWSAGIPEAVGDDWQNMMTDEASHLYNAQAVAYLTLPEGYAPWSLFDLGLFSQNLLLEATNHELGSIVAYQFVKYPEILRKELEISDNEQIIIGVGLGYRDEKAEINRINSKRMAVEDVLEILD